MMDPPPPQHPTTTASPTTTTAAPATPSSNAHKYRGATVEDLDPPPALSLSPTTPLTTALLLAYERDYTHLTVLDPDHKSLLGYLSIPALKTQLASGQVKESDAVQDAMVRFKREGRRYRVITMETRLEDLEEFYSASGTDFAVVTDWDRRFVLGVATREDLNRFLSRRPG